MASPEPVAPGAEVVYSLTVANGGPDTATGVTVTDPLPPGATLVSATPSQGTCGGTATVVCALGTLAPGGSASISIVVRAGPSGPLVNRATVSGDQPDPNGSNDSSTAVTDVAGTSIPALSLEGLLALAIGLAAAALLALRRGPWASGS